MKTLLTLFLVAFALSSLAQTQPNFIPRVNGGGTNTTVTNAIVFNSFVFKTGSSTNFAIAPVSTGVSFLNVGVAIAGMGNLGSPAFHAWTFSTNVVLVGPGAFIGNGRGLTNITEAGIAVVTNTWGNAVVNFSLGTMVATNMAGDLTITGITGFNPTNLNWQTAFLSPGAAVRAVAVPADWWVSGFTNATTVSIPSSNTAILSVRCQVGIFTNASIELFQ